MIEVIIEKIELESALLGRTVQIDIYRCSDKPLSGESSLALINDGQDLVTMGFDIILQEFFYGKKTKPLMVAGIHGGAGRMHEFGVASGPDYLGRGAGAVLYEQFLVLEALPCIHKHFNSIRFIETAIAGFSLGGLTAFDTAWNHPEIFSRVGVFSGSLWWRSKNKDDKDYHQDIHRMAHRQVRQGSFHPGMKFFFQCGEQDEKADRNRNGVIDSIDDTIDLMRELLKKGYREGPDILYRQLPDGKHNIEAWAKSLPFFLQWGWDK
ncbi:MAG: alpha/beta hydrolase-fold protein [Flavitalea sp.]